MTWKKVINADSGDADHHGGDSLDKVSDLFSGVDVDDVAINVDWKFDHFVDLKAVAEPTTPASGYVRFFIDSADGLIKIKKSNGDVVIIE